VLRRTPFLAAALALAIPAAAQAAPKPADRVLLGGAVYTAERAGITAEAVAIRDGAIAYVGTDRGARRYVGKRTKVTNLRGKMVMPGLHDGHIHGITAPADECSLNYEPLTVAEFSARIKACLDASDGEWLVVSSWYQQFVIPSGTVLTKETLDAISTTRAIVVKSSDGHTALANSRALALANITAATPDPADGRIERAADGSPNGLLQDGAQGLVEALIPAPEGDPVGEARRGMQRFAEEGITSFFVPGVFGADAIAPFDTLRRRGQLTARAHFAAGPPDPGDSSAKVLRAARKLRAKYESRLPRSVTSWRPGKQRGPKLVAKPGISVDGVKLFLDGVLQAPAQTAAVLEPYVGTDSRGELYVDNPALGRMVRDLERAGYQSHIHAIGDRAVRTALDAYTAMRKANGKRDSRPSIAHAELVARSDLRRFASLDVLPVMSYQWAKPAPDSTDSVLPFLGPERVDLYEPEGQLQAAGARIAFGSDYPVDGLDEFFAVEVAVLREADWGPEFPQYAGKLNADPGLTLDQALRGITINAAHQMHQDAVTGSLARGKLADLIVLDRNLFAIPEDDISETEVVTTMVGGRVVHQR
jgi:predicted amidohydrolase YtcJ